jgi:hypothetical protein
LTSSKTSLRSSVSRDDNPKSHSEIFIGLWPEPIRLMRIGLPQITGFGPSFSKTITPQPSSQVERQKSPMMLSMWIGSLWRGKIILSLMRSFRLVNQKE